MEDFSKYLDSMPFTKVLKDRINDIIILNKKIYTEEILDILVCNFKNADTTINYSSLWLFTSKSFSECKNFLTHQDFDITPITEKLVYCSIQIDNFDLEKPNENSKVNIHITFNESITGDIIAVGENCYHAVEIYKKHIIANLK